MRGLFLLSGIALSAAAPLAAQTFRGRPGNAGLESAPFPAALPGTSAAPAQTLSIGLAPLSAALPGLGSTPPGRSAPAATADAAAPLPILPRAATPAPDLALPASAAPAGPRPVADRLGMVAAAKLPAGRAFDNANVAPGADAPGAARPGADSPEPSWEAAHHVSELGFGRQYEDPAHPVVQEALKIAAELGSRDILDLAAGRGVVSLALLGQDPSRRVVAADIDEAALSVARRRAAAEGLSLRARRLDAAGKLPGAWRSRFDLVVAKDLYPFLDPAQTRAFLRNAAAALKPGGRLLLTAPSTASRLFRNASGRTGTADFYLRLSAEEQAFVPTTRSHFNFVDEAELRRLLAEAGLTLEEARPYGRAGGWLIAAGRKAPATTDESARLQELLTSVRRGNAGELPRAARRHEFLLVPSFNWDALGKRYFEPNLERLRRLGLKATMVETDPLGVAADNARIVKAAVERAEGPVVLLSHSKGGLDVLAALRLFPELRDKIRAVVTLQTPHAGTPLADAFLPRLWLYDLLMAAGRLLNPRRLFATALASWHETLRELSRAGRAAFAGLSPVPGPRLFSVATRVVPAGVQLLKARLFPEVFRSDTDGVVPRPPPSYPAPATRCSTASAIWPR